MRPNTGAVYDAATGQITPFSPEAEEAWWERHRIPVDAVAQLENLLAREEAIERRIAEHGR